jgi:hypothetical protein
MPPLEESCLLPFLISIIIISFFAFFVFFVFLGPMCPKGCAVGSRAGLLSNGDDTAANQIPCLLLSVG